MNRNVSALLFFASAVFIAGCSGSHSGGMGSTGPTGPGAGPAGPVDIDIEAFARVGMTDPEYVESRDVNDQNFVSNENSDAFADWF